ncbi:hypothetical protein EJ02DRAFT_466085 [Clathrospora elynae]|uniref:Uncharacterized protein n=1 Tax=Clathrospora elynae TaxID=706981 RepID=A0A6A5SN81_9PLEO|nr:hypothetical protein EJ02DRAFT_466085 [Clathrospora elynae]
MPIRGEPRLVGLSPVGPLRTDATSTSLARQLYFDNQDRRSETSPPEEASMAQFSAARADIYHAHALLHYRLGLPNELVLDILEKARYWIEETREISHYEALLDTEFSPNFSTAFPYMGARAIPVTHPRHGTLKIREIEFTIVSHDQGWTTEATKGTHQTSSWFEVSILRPKKDYDVEEQDNIANAFTGKLEARSNIYASLDENLLANDLQFVSRPSANLEPQRKHCQEMQTLRFLEDEDMATDWPPTGIEGEDTWYLQGNEVARGKSIFEGELVRRYRIVWGCKENPTWVGNEGTGRGEQFVDSLRYGDWICVWARAKAFDREEGGRTTSMAFA